LPLQSRLNTLFFRLNPVTFVLSGPPCGA
jgi:hypothetical protein